MKCALCLVVALVGCKIEGRVPPADAPSYTPPPPPAPFAPPAPMPEPRRLVILHTNDEHSHLLGFGPVSEYPYLPEDDGTVDPARVITALATAQDDQTVGGVVRRNFLVNRIRSAATDPVLLVSAGDNLMGSILHA